MNLLIPTPQRVKRKKKCVKLYSDILIPACVNESIPERSVKQSVNEEGEEEEG